MRERVCKNCGGRSYKVVGQSMVKCMFCGTLYVDEHSSREEDVLLVGAFELLREQKFDAALAEFEKILTLYPLSFESYFGKTLAKHKIIMYTNKKGLKRRPKFFDTPTSITNDEDFKKAIELAPPETIKTYKDAAKRIDKYIAKYNEQTQKHDVFVLVMQDDQANQLEIHDKLVEGLKHEGLSVFVLKDQDEGEVFYALQHCKAFVLYANVDKGYTNGDVKNIIDRYLYFISSRKKAKSSLLLAVDGVGVEVLPPEIRLKKNAFNAAEVSFLADITNRIKKEVETFVDAVAKIDKVKIEKASPKRKEYLEVENIEPTDLGHYHVENVEMSDAAKIKWIYLTLKNGDFASAKEMIASELEKDPNNAELLFAQYLEEKKIKTPDEFFENISNFDNREKIDNILTYADREFAEDFVDRWEDLIIKLNSEDYLNAYLLYLAKYNSENRKELIDFAERKAIETLNEELIEKVERCFNKDDVQRFVNFYFALAQASDDNKYYQKVLAIDEGHEQSNLIMFLEKLRSTEDILNYRDKEEVENVLKFLSEDVRANVVEKVIEIILPVSFLNLTSAQAQIDFYLSYVVDENRLVEILKKTGDDFLSRGFFKVAEKYFSIAISKKNSGELFWEYIKAIAHCKNDQELITSEVKLTQLPEWQTLIEISTDQEKERFAEITSKANLYNGEKKKISAELLDAQELSQKLQEFINRNNAILLQFEKEKDNFAGVEYHKKQLEPFKVYVEQISKIKDFEDFQNLNAKIDSRLEALDLTLDMSISALHLEKKESGLKKIIIPKEEIEEKREQSINELKKGNFLKKFSILFFEFAPILFSMLIFILLVALPKEVYLVFSQEFLVACLLVSLGIAFGNLIWYTSKKKKSSKLTKVLNIVLIVLGVVNLALFCFAFYLMPQAISIKNAKEMKKLLTNAGHASYVLETDIDMSGVKWTGVNFSGELDGKGHKLQNLKLSKGGLFKTNSGEIKLLEIYLAESVISNSGSFGVIVDENSGTIKDCAVYGNINISCSSALNVGGIVGTHLSGDIEGCKVEIVMNITTAGAEVDAGALVGKIDAGNESIKIVDNVASSTIKLEAQSQAVANVAGLIGRVEKSGDVLISQNEAHVQIDLSGNFSALSAGGLIGYGFKQTTNSYSTGTIVATQADGELYLGGLYGQYDNTSVKEPIKHCYSTIIIEGEATKGALIGALGGVVDSCFTTTDIDFVGQKKFSVAQEKNCLRSYKTWLNFDGDIWDFSEELPKLKH